MTGSLTQQWASLQMQLDAHRPDMADPSTPLETTTPVVLLTGFLGAGKTTLLVDLLTSPPTDVRIRAIVNDVGSLPFDPSLIATNAELQVELTNGCVCCQSTENLALSLDDAAVHADLVVLEASGVADPYALAQVIEARPTVHLDRIVSVVDAVAIHRLLEDRYTAGLAERQLVAAHVVILAKTDRLPRIDQELVIASISELVPGRPVVCSSTAQPASHALLASTAVGARLPCDRATLDGQLITVTAPQTREISMADLRQTFASQPRSIMRSKGTLIAQNCAYLVQSTWTDHSIEPIREVPNGELTIVGTTKAAIADFGTKLGCTVI
jgi:G3E family GTPase